MAAISLKNVVKRYGIGPKANQVIHGVNAEIADGEFIVIVGPSGCGKSTLLRMVAGLEEISAGTISIVPPLISSSPAIIRSAVDLPHPDGPTSTMNSWSWMSRSRFGMTVTGPYAFLTWWNVTSAMLAPLPRKAT